MIMTILKVVLGSLSTIAAKLIIVLATEKYITKLIIFGAEKIVKYTTNKIDDEIVAELKERLNFN